MSDTSSNCVNANGDRITSEIRLLPYCWVLYDRPRDFPTRAVVRRWINGRPALIAKTYETVDAARAVLAEDGLVCIGREPGDDPVIVEVWV